MVGNGWEMVWVYPTYVIQAGAWQGPLYLFFYMFLFVKKGICSPNIVYNMGFLPLP